MHRPIALLLCLFPLAAADAQQAPKPNILVILADDMGFSDVGCYGSEIQTPNLDALAANGLRFTQFYNTARCWPTRSALLSGYYPQQIRIDAPTRSDTPPPWFRLLPSYLNPLGYRCWHSGKWHVTTVKQVLAGGGFARSYVLDDHNRNFYPKDHRKDDNKLPPVAPDAGYYSTTAITDYALEFLKEHADKHKDQPFFGYLAYTVPHFPLHAPAEDIARIQDRYRKGWDIIRKERAERLKQLGIVTTPAAEPEADLAPRYVNNMLKKFAAQIGNVEVMRALPWEKLTPEQQEFQAMKMAIHAAMVERMDIEIGRVIAQLKAMGTFENTLILFLSDNGASAELNIRGDEHDRTAAPGSAKSFLCLGPGWSTAANTPFRRHKIWTHEGGVATPLIAHWPKGIAAKGELRHDVGHVVDFVPTFLELTGAQGPTAGPPFAGISLVPAFAKDRATKREFVYFDHEGNRGLRVGDWKIVSAREEKEAWELFDLSKDRAETKNLAGAHPEKLKELAEKWENLRAQYVKDAGGIPKR